MAVATIALAAASPASAQIRVGPPVHVSVARSGEAHYEVLGAAHPSDPRRLLIGSMLQPRASAMVSGSIAYVSGDGGATWKPTLETPPSDALADASGDPAVAFGPDGTAWFTASLLPPNSGAAARSMLLYRSPDGGERWDAPTRFTYSDRQYITIDHSGGPYHGRIHVNGNGRVGAAAGGLTNFWSSDDGRTFTESILPRQPVAPVMGNAVVLSDGTLVALHSAEAGARGSDARRADVMRVRLLASASRDGGQSFGAPADIALTTLVTGRKGGHNNTSNGPMMAADASRTATRDRLYAVWPEHRDDHTVIQLSFSADGGRSWSAPRVVSDADTPGRDHFMPNVAVNRDGVVGVAWYDRRDRADNIGWDVRFAASLDGGVTFLPSVRVSAEGMRFGTDDAWIIEARATTTPAPALDLSLNTFTFLGGDTAGLVADASGVFHAVWIDNSTGLPQVWTAPITVSVPSTGATGASANAQPSASAGARTTGERDRASALRETRVDATAARPAPAHAVARGNRTTPERPGRDVTAQVTLDVSDPRYDRATNVLAVRVRLTNASGSTLDGPFLLLPGAIRSELGTANAHNADTTAADQTGWAFSVPDGGPLRPGAHTEARELAFLLTDLRPFRDADRYRRGLVHFAWTVLAR